MEVGGPAASLLGSSQFAAYLDDHDEVELEDHV